MADAKRYRWSKQSEVFHDLNFSVERCNVDDMKGYEESDEPPQMVRHARYRRLCYMCRKHQELVEGVTPPPSRFGT